MSENIKDKISMKHKKGKHKKERHKHDVISHVMSLLSWWTLGQVVGDFVVRHRRDRILTLSGIWVFSIFLTHILMITILHIEQCCCPTFLSIPFPSHDISRCLCHCMIITVLIRPFRMVIVIKGSAGRVFSQVSSVIEGPPLRSTHVIKFPRFNQEK